MKKHKKVKGESRQKRYSLIADIDEIGVYNLSRENKIEEVIRRRYVKNYLPNSSECDISFPVDSAIS